MKRLLVAVAALLVTATAQPQSQLAVAPSYVTSTAITINSPVIVVGAVVQAVATLQPSLTDVSALCSIPGPNTVTWSSSAPSVATISAAGLITGVSGGSATVSCTLNGLVGTGTVQVEAVPYITNPTCASPPCSLPQGTNGTAYSFIFQETGGVGAVTWTVISGAIPSWAALNSSTGALTGTPSANATTSFTIKVTDSASNSSSLAVTLTVASSGACGPPTYPCSRIDLVTQKLPATMPSLGGLVGINNIISDTLGNGNRIVRATDSTFNPAKPNKELVVTSGSGDDNVWSRNVGNHYLLCINDSGSLEYVIDFNKSTFQVSRPYASQFPSTGGITIGASVCEWGFTSNRAYVVGTAVSKTGTIGYYDFTDWLSGPQTTPPTLTGLFDFTELTPSLPNYNSGKCLPSAYATPTWEDEAEVSKDDQTYASAFSISGNQGTAVKLAAYRIGSGCSTLDTSTGAVQGDWGSTGTATIPGGLGGFTIHNTKISKDGNWLIIACTKNCPASPTGAPFLWQIGTLNLYLLSQGEGNGHWTEGYLNWINGFNSPVGQKSRRLYTAPASPSTILSNTQFPTAIVYPFDFHAGYANANSTDTYAIMVTNNEPLASFIGVANTSGVTVNWISGHVFSTSWSGSMDVGGVSYPIASCASTIVCTLATSAGTQSGASYSFPPYNFAWESEIDMVFPNSGTVAQGTTVRMAQCMSTGTDAHIFDAANCIGSVSQDGAYNAFTSDWAGMLGSNTGGTTCSTTSNCRSDVLINENR